MDERKKSVTDEGHGKAKSITEKLQRNTLVPIRENQHFGQKSELGITHNKKSSEHGTKTLLQSMND